MPFTIIATKADKIPRTALRKNINTIAAELKCGAGNIIAVSAKNRYGLEDILERTEQILNTAAGADGDEDA